MKKHIVVGLILVVLSICVAMFFVGTKHSNDQQDTSTNTPAEVKPPLDEEDLTLPPPPPPPDAAAFFKEIEDLNTATVSESIEE